MMNALTPVFTAARDLGFESDAADAWRAVRIRLFDAETDEQAVAVLLAAADAAEREP